MADPYRIEGGCLCGKIRFEVTSPPTRAAYCHCTRCQRRTGTGSSVSAMVPAEGFKLLSGEDHLGSWRHPDGGSAKYFCRDCGAHLFAIHPDHPSRVNIRMAAFDSDPGVRPTLHQYVAYAPPWEPIPDDGLERFSESAY